MGAGPYKLVSWDMGQSIILEKFDDFYLGAPEIDNVIFKKPVRMIHGPVKSQFGYHLVHVFFRD